MCIFLDALHVLKKRCFFLPILPGNLKQSNNNAYVYLKLRQDKEYVISKDSIQTIIWRYTENEFNMCNWYMIFEALVIRNME